MSDVPCDKHSQDHRDGCAECCVDELQFREVERTGLLETSEKHCKALVLRLEEVQKGLLAAHENWKDADGRARAAESKLYGCMDALAEIYQPYFKAKPEYRPSADTIIEQVGTVLSKYNEPAYGSAVERQETK